MAAPPDDPPRAAPGAGRRRVRLLAWALAAFALIGLLGFLVVPPVARGQLERVLSSELGRQVAIGRVAFNPYTLRVEFGDVSVAGAAPGAAPMLALESLSVDLDAPVSLMRMAPVLESVQLVSPTVRVARDREGRLDLEDVLAKLAQPPKDPAAPAARFAVSDLAVRGARVLFDDAKVGRLHEVSGLEITVPFLSSLDAHAAIEAESTLSATVNGSALQLKARGRPFAADRRAALEVSVSGADAVHYLAYLPEALPVEVASLRLGARLEVGFAQPAGQPPTLSVAGRAEASAIELRTRAGALLSADAVRAEGLALRPLESVFEVARIVVEGSSVTVARRRGEARFLEPVLAWLERGRTGPAPAAQPSGAVPRWRVGEIALSGGRLDFVDERFSPRPLAFRLDAVRLGVHGAASGFPEAIRVEAAAELNGGGRLEASASLAPSAREVEVDGKVAVDGLNLAPWSWLADPYLQAEVAVGRLSARTGFRFAGGANGGGSPKVALPGLAAELSGLVVRQRWDRREFLRVASLKLEDTDLDLPGRSLRLGALSGSGARVALERDRDGAFNFERLLRPEGAGNGAQGPAAAPADRAAAPAATGAPMAWRVAVQKLAVDGGEIALRDVAAGPAADLLVSRLALRAEGLSTEPKARGRVLLKAGVGRTGSLELGGALSLQPLAGRLRINAQGIGLLAAQPYFADRVAAIVSSGALTARGDLRFSVAPQQPPKAGFNGELTVSDLGVVTREGNEELLRWKSLYLGGVGVELDPLKVDLDQVALTDFFARIVLRADGRTNLQDLLVREGGGGDPPPAAASGERPERAASPPTQVSAKGPDAAGGTPAAAPALRIGRVTLANGEVDFTDLFIRPNFDAHLSGLNGAVGTMSADTAGDLELRGRINETGSIEVSGRINPFAPSAFVDLKARARDIDLPRTSPYAVRYLGYGIERGKLSADVSYRLEDRKLDARNNVVLDQLTFGERVESPTATRLPVLFAVSLLKDRNGVIEVDLPIGGSIDDPDFSVGGIVLRMIFNLIGKALTAPFSLLAGLGQGAEQLSQVEFAAGRATLGPEAQKRLETLAKALTDRPGLKVDLGGRVDAEQDREALRRLSVDRRIKAQKLRGQVASGTDAAALDAIVIEPDEYPRLLLQAYRAASFPKPRNAIGLVRDLPPEEMEKLLLVNADVDERALRELADQRAAAVKAWLTGPGGIAGERLFVVAPRLTAEGLAAGRSPLAVDVSLK